MSSTRYAWRLLNAGPIKLDGGGMFGVVPRTLWSKSITPDERNRITLAHNCLLLAGPDGRKLVIETGSGDKFDAKGRDMYGLTDRSILTAMAEVGALPADVSDVVVTHLHFDHAGGLTRRGKEGEPELTFPNAKVHVQRREWQDADANTSVMTRTYLREHLDPIRDKLVLHEAPSPFPLGHVPTRDESPAAPLADRLLEVAPGVFVFLVPGHTWGQQAVLFTDDRGRTVVFTPDVLPTIHHVGSAYSLAYDVEPYVSSVSRRWFLQAAVDNDWLLVLDHEPGYPCVRVRPDVVRGWYQLIPDR